MKKFILSLEISLSLMGNSLTKEQKENYIKNVNEEMENLYDKSNCSNINELNNHLDINKLSVNTQYYIKNYDEIKAFYNEKKENYIKAFIKNRINKEIEDKYYSNYFIQNISKLKNLLDIKNLSNDIQEYIKKNDDIKNYYIETKENYIDKFIEKQDEYLWKKEKNIKEKKDKFSSLEEENKQLIKEKMENKAEIEKMKSETEKYKKDIKEQEDKLKKISEKNEKNIETIKKEINRIMRNSLDKLKEKEEEMRKNAEQKQIQYEEEKKN